MSDSELLQGSIDISRPRWDQNTFSGRARHFFVVTNPFNLLKTTNELEYARRVVTNYKKGDVEKGLTVDGLWKQKYVYDSAFHPDTGEKTLLIGRMSAQVPMNMTITGFMMTFYKTSAAVVFWQGINQTFNAIVNYSNRSGDQPISNRQLGVSFCLATTGAIATALGLNSLVKKAPPLVGRLVPFAAVAAANCVNIPMMRMREFTDGIPVFAADGTRVGDSVAAAQRAVPMVVLSRIGMAAPGMAIPPLVMNYLDRRTSVLARRPWLGAPIQVALCGLCLSLATPICCAFFPQRSSLPLASLEPHLQRVARQNGVKDGQQLFFNKGL